MIFSTLARTDGDKSRVARETATFWVFLLIKRLPGKAPPETTNPDKPVTKLLRQIVERQVILSVLLEKICNRATVVQIQIDPHQTITDV